jgi:hypothetical protein
MLAISCTLSVCAIDPGLAWEICTTFQVRILHFDYCHMKYYLDRYDQKTNITGRTVFGKQLLIHNLIFLIKFEVFNKRGSAVSDTASHVYYENTIIFRSSF